MSREDVNGQPFSKVITDINKIATEIRGGIPSKYHVDIENRLAIAVVERKRYARKEKRQNRSDYLTNSRGNRASKLYLQVLDHNYHLFIPFILAVTPRACADLKIEVILQHDWAVQTDNSTETKQLIESMALRRSFSENPIYIKFVKSMFPTVLSQVHRNTASDIPQQQDVEQSLLASNGPYLPIQEQGLTGDVYELTVEDVQTVTVTMSYHIVGKILLTDTYETSTASFITIPISDELTSQFLERPRLM